MLKIYMGAKFDSWAENKNYFLIFEGIEEEYQLELHHCNSVAPFKGGVITEHEALKLRDWLNQQYPT